MARLTEDRKLLHKIQGQSAAKGWEQFLKHPVLRPHPLCSPVQRWLSMRPGCSQGHILPLGSGTAVPLREVGEFPPKSWMFLHLTPQSLETASLLYAFALVTM